MLLEATWAADRAARAVCSSELHRDRSAPGL